MLTPTELEAVSNDISRIYEQTETACIESIVKRLSMDKGITNYSAWQLKKLNDAGLLRKELVHTISQQSKKSVAEVKVLIETSLRKAYASDMSKAGNITFKDAWEKALLSKAYKSTVKSAIKSITNILNVTNTKALQSGLDLYRNCVNEMYYAVATGVVDFDRAYRKAVKTIGQSGIKITTRKDVLPDLTSSEVFTRGGNMYATYDSGVVYPVDSAIRRDVITQLNQASAEMSLENCDTLGVKYVITSQHYGARPEHELWQGKVFSLDKNDTKYPYFYAPQSEGGTGYGTEITGLCGINCRHSFFPYTEGDEKPKHISREENNKVYEEQQTQRRYESRLRTLKREQIAFRTADDRHNAELVQYKINETQASYKQFLNDTGRRRETMLDSITDYHPIKVKGSN